MTTTGQQGRTVSRRVGEQVRRLVLETDNYVDSVARTLGLHRTDVTAIGTLADASREGADITPSELARRVHLSAAAVTALLDRLQRVGHANRSRHATDRRRVVVGLTPGARRVSREMFAPLNAAQDEALAGYTDEELDLVVRVLADLGEATRRVSLTGEIPSVGTDGTTEPSRRAEENPSH